MELATGRELLVFATLLFAILAVMWVLATTRPHADRTTAADRSARPAPDDRRR